MVEDTVPWSVLRSNVFGRSNLNGVDSFPTPSPEIDLSTV